MDRKEFLEKQLDLLRLDVSDKTEKKKTGSTELTYLSWAWAWAEFIKVFPEATYNIITNENGLPYFASDEGVMCYTEITAGEVTRRMWLPVMDGANNAMKPKEYTYDTKYKQGILVKAFDMFDVNKTIMRCLVKNLAMFGLGLNIYAGEDLPIVETTMSDILAMDLDKVKEMLMSNASFYSHITNKGIKIEECTDDFLRKSLAKIMGVK